MASIAHFDIGVDDVDRATKFYTELFGWRVEASPARDYWLIYTQEGAGGGIMKRQNPDQRITDYFGVTSAQEFSDKVQRLGGKVIVPKTAVSNMGYFVVCLDTEGNVFGLWEDDPQAK